MIRVKSNRQAVLVSALAIGVMMASANCARKDAPAPSDETGAFHFSLRLSSLAQVDAVDYKVSGNSIVPITGTIDVSNVNVGSATVSGLPAAKGYLVEATAVSTDGKTRCTGDATFEIVSGQEAQAHLILQCKGPSGTGTGAVRIDGSFDNCPLVTAIVTKSSVAPIGGTISLFGTYSDLDGDDVSFIWQQAPQVGSFASSTSARTDFKCEHDGGSVLHLSVSDGTCGQEAVISIVCGFLPMDGGIDAPSDAGSDAVDAPATGGTSGSGGAQGTGGTTGSGGAGGDLDGGGWPGSGGATGAGGASSSGGATGAGGVTGAGGLTGAGGAPLCTVPSHCAGILCDQCSFGPGPGEADRCAEVENGCTNCIATTDGCDTLAPADRLLCENLYACLVANTHPGTAVPGPCITKGDPLVCWCGTNPTTCGSDNAPPTQANGPCLQQIFAAAKTSDAATINLRFIDAGFPLGRAVNLAACHSNFCSKECNVTP